MSALFVFAANIVPSAGCTVTAGDGGVDTAEAPNGIACSGTTATNDPLCTEQYQNSALATLKVTTEPGYGFNGWIVDGAHMQMTSAEPLFLSTRPVLADNGANVQVKNGCTETQADCQKQTVYLTFDDGPRKGTDDVARILNALHEATDVRGSFFMTGFHTYLSGKGDVDMMNEAAYAQLTDCERILYVEPYLSEEPYNNQRKYFKEWPWMKDQVNALNALNTNTDVVTILNHGYIHPDPTRHVLSITPSKYYTEWSPSQVVEDFTCNKERLLKAGASNGNFSIARCPTKNFWRLSNYDQPDGSGKEAADLLRGSDYQLYGWDVLWEFTEEGRPAESVNSVINKIKEKFDKNASSPVKRNKVIVLMHDIMFRHSNEGDDVKLEALIQELHNLGYDFGILPQY